MPNLNARELRRNPTEAERVLWRHLRLNQIAGCQFRRQAPMGNYIVDFVCFKKRLVIEVDGGQHLEQEAHDTKRTAWLESQGFQVLRFGDNQVFSELDAVKQSILEALTDNHHLTPPPKDNGGHRSWSSRMFKSSMLALLLLAIACTPAEPAPAQTATSTREPTATRVPPTSTAAQTATPSMFGTKYSAAVQTRIDEMAERRDCAGLQAEFDTASRNDTATRSRTGSGTADLMGYIDGKLRAAECYR